MSNLDAKMKQSMEILDEALREHENVTSLFGMFSGGHDSVTSTCIASLHPSFSGAVHIDTTIGIPQTRAYVDRISEMYQWRLKTYRPPVSYRDIVLKHGFPGPGGHLFMYTRLKERCVRQIVREHKFAHRDRVGLVTGVRLSESTRRMGHVKPIQRIGCQLWIAPILHWDDVDKLEFMERYQIPRNPVVDTICMSGECLCGAFAKKEELVELELSFPDVAQNIHDLERDAAKAGVHCKWGTRPPGKRKSPTAGGMLCAGCNAKSGL